MKRGYIALALALLIINARAFSAGCVDLGVLAYITNPLTTFVPMKTRRDLADYLELLGPTFYDALRELGSDDVWMDIGGGSGNAQRQYQRIIDEVLPAKAHTINVEPRKPLTAGVRRWLESKYPNGDLRNGLDALSNTGDKFIQKAPMKYRQQNPDAQALGPVTAEGKARHEDWWGKTLGDVRRSTKAKSASSRTAALR